MPRTCPYTPEQVRERLLAIPEPVTVEDIVQAVTGGPTDDNLGFAFACLTQIAAGQPLISVPRELTFTETFARSVHKRS